MLVKRYKIEGYEDIIHQYGYFRHTELYVEKYNMVIRLDSNKIMFVQKATKPNNVYCLNPKDGNKEYPIEEIDIEDEFMESCYKLLQKQNEINDYKDVIHKSFDFSKFLSNDDISENMFEDAQFEYKMQKYKEAIDKYNEVINFTHNQMIKQKALYNIACCYCLKENYSESIKYLNLAFENGFYDWEHVLMDNDFKDFNKLISENKTLFFEVIKKMLEKNHFNSKRYSTYYKQYDKLHPAIRILKENNINFPNIFAE
jgi:tetratricopeptide (TPR) repeat protein